MTSHPTRDRFVGSIRTALALGILALLSTGWLAAPLAAQSNALDHFGSGLTWPTDAQWTAVSGFTDPDDGLTDYLDFVGDATYPCLYTAVQNGYVFFRIRVQYPSNVTTSSPFEKGGTVGVLINYYDAGDDGYPDYGFLWDAKQDSNVNHGLELNVRGTTGALWGNCSMDDADGSSGQKVWDVAQDLFDFRNLGTDGYVRTVDEVAAGGFGTTCFVDIAVSLSFLDYIHAQNPTKYKLQSGQSWGLQIVSILNANDHAAFNCDIGNNLSISSAVGGWSAQTITLAELGAFTARYADSRMRIEWETLAERDNAGFHLWRAADGDPSYQRLTASMIEAKGGPAQTTPYSFLDDSVQEGRGYLYKLEDIDASGRSSFHGPIPGLASTISPLSPPDGFLPPSPGSLSFEWDGGAFAFFRLELSADADFSGSVMTLPGVDQTQWTPRRSYKPKTREWARIDALAGSSGIVYWRVLGLTPEGAEGLSLARWLKVR